MQALTLYGKSELGSAHPVEGMLRSDPDYQIEQALNLQLKVDGTILVLFLLSNPDLTQTLSTNLDEHEDVIDYQFFSNNQNGFLFLHLEPGEPVSTLLYLGEEYNFLLNPPVQYGKHGAIRATVIGTQESLREAFRNLPDSISVNVERIDEFVPSEKSYFSGLSSRQKEALEIALELGYYQIPREVNLEDIGERLGCSASTVNQLLRRAEEEIITKSLGFSSQDTL